MDYIKLLNRFWQRHREASFTPAETALYFALLAICNGLRWKNPFQHSNQLLYVSLNITEKTLIAARTKLQSAGLLTYQPGHKRYPTTYWLATHDHLLGADDTLENSRSKLQSFPVLSEGYGTCQLPDRLENTASSVKKTRSSLSNQTVGPRTTTDELSADDSPLVNAEHFVRILREGNYAHVDIETYRLQMLATARDNTLALSLPRWRKWIISYLNNDRAKDALLLAAQASSSSPTLHGSIGDLHAKGTVQQPIL
ncbi:hypothetical protein Q5H93_21445 [Hymenobacter sp. ASUV-10]|uniref:Helix-turn-helix domain-containing protein n=1 Tax=Hymenobacter aranciens TaxID=3063996 RepID=A0ABT9BGE0_9BACT|nr:hypothetical protein [Hymenobacter sp. ASUV-10]MDO7877324.1 hypothetical protein [Hymenobacter sp. ASUV-10]